MFSKGMDVVLEYRTVPSIINYSLSMRAMKVVNSRFLVICDSAGWMMVFKVRYIYKRFSQVAVNEDGCYGNP